LGHKIEENEMVGHVAHMGEKRNAYRVLVGKPKGKIPLGRPRCRWEDNTKLGLKEMRFEGVNWLYLSQDRGKCVNGNETLFP
jgi:hypothetical protein